MATVTMEMTLTVVNCGCCGGVYAIGTRFHQKCREESKSWTCPYCRTGWGFQGKTEAQKLQEELDQERRRRAAAEGSASRARERAEHQERRAAAYKGHLTRTKKRVANGVCPCCNRHFRNLHDHMKDQHPEYSGEVEA